MNIIKLQDMLRGVPDQALINYVQNPQGEVPSYLALSELQRRKDTRAKYQSQQAPESSVAEDLEQETMSDQGGLAMLAKNPDLSPGAPDSQGVASLPVDEGMYQEQNFAGGGIVAFAGKDGSYVQSYPNYEGPATSAIGRGLDYITGGIKNYANKKSKLMDLQQQIETLQPNLFESLTPSELSTRKAKIEELKAQQDAIRNPSSGYVYKEGEKAVDPTMKSYVEQEAMRKTEGKGKGLILQSDEEKAKLLKDKEGKGVGVQTETAQTQTEQKPGESYEDSLRRRMAIYKEFMGDDSDKTKLKEKIDAMEKRAARQEEMAPWMALTEAGFKTMQGTSPFALANIGAGAEAGIKSYGAAQDKLAALEEKRYALMNDAAKADRAERQAAITFGENSYQHQAAMEQKDRIANMNAQLKREEIKASKDVAAMKISSDANLLKMANFGIKDQAAIEKYVKDKMGTDSLILENLRKLESQGKLDEKKKALLKTYVDKEARIQKEAMQKFDVNSLINKAKPGLAGTQFKSSDFTVEELTGQ